jgi:hypothetical protein
LVSIGIGEIISAYVLGMMLFLSLRPHARMIFKGIEKGLKEE